MNKTSELFWQIEELVPKLDGWCIPSKACDFAAFILAFRPEVSVEVGVWGGRGTLSMALAHRFIARGRVIAIDPWSAEASVIGQAAVDAQWWGNQSMHDQVYAKFLKDIDQLNLQGWIEVQKKKSADAALPPVIHFAVIDGNHAEEAIADVDRIAPRVPVGGVIYLDDLQWTGGAVGRAADNLKGMGFTTLFERDQGAFFQRLK